MIARRKTSAVQNRINGIDQELKAMDDHLISLKRFPNWVYLLLLSSRSSTSFYGQAPFLRKTQNF
jgi:hypothetical protein